VDQQASRLEKWITAVAVRMKRACFQNEPEVHKRMVTIQPVNQIGYRNQTVEVVRAKSHPNSLKKLNSANGDGSRKLS
jgi:hypothetical protein